MSKFPNPDTQFKPGQSGNPQGRAPGTKNRATILNRLCELQADSIPALKKLMKEGALPKGITVEEAINYALVREAAKGDISAIREMQDTVHGKLVDKTEVGLSFTQMGKVMIKTDENGKQSLSFEVGQKAEE